MTSSQEDVAGVRLGGCDVGRWITLIWKALHLINSIATSVHQAQTRSRGMNRRPLRSYQLGLLLASPPPASLPEESTQELVATLAQLLSQAAGADHRTEEEEEHNNEREG